MKTTTALWLAIIATTISGIFVGLSQLIFIGIGLHYHPEPPIQTVLKLSIILVSIFPIILLFMGKRLSGKTFTITLITIALFGIFFAALGSVLLVIDRGDALLYFPFLAYGVFMLISAYFLKELKLEIDESVL